LEPLRLTDELWLLSNSDSLLVDAVGGGDGVGVDVHRGFGVMRPRLREVTAPPLAAAVQRSRQDPSRGSRRLEICGSGLTGVGMTVIPTSDDGRPGHSSAARADDVNPVGHPVMDGCRPGVIV
jgi:hypothetical protein